MASQQTKPVVAVIFDFDDTLAPDSTSQLLEALGVDVPKFWHDEVKPLVRSGWDPVPAYLYRMIEWSQAGRFSEPLGREPIERAGRAIELYPGVDTLFERLQETVSELSTEITLEFYVVTSGLERLVAATEIGPLLIQWWGCELHYSNEGHALFPRNLVSFTDVPCFSLVAGRGGILLSVVDPTRRERWGRAWGFIEEGRSMNVCLTDFSPGSSTEMVLCMALQSVCDRMALQGRVYQN